MKKYILTLVAILAVCVNASALSKSRSREEARFLTDKMAYELDLTDEQLQDIYEINYDYFRSLGPVDGYYDSYYDRRYRDLSYVLYDWQWNEFLLRDYFLRPAYIYRGGWAFGIYNYYARTHFFYGIPHIYHTYHGGHYHTHNYYLGRRDMHYRAVSARGPRPGHIADRRPQMNRPNIGHNGNMGISHNRAMNNRRSNGNINHNNNGNHSNGQMHQNGSNNRQQNMTTRTPERSNRNNEVRGSSRSSSNGVSRHQGGSTRSSQATRSSSTRSSSSVSRGSSSMGSSRSAHAGGSRSSSHSRGGRN